MQKKSIGDLIDVAEEEMESRRTIQQVQNKGLLERREIDTHDPINKSNHQITVDSHALNGTDKTMGSNNLMFAKIITNQCQATALLDSGSSISLIHIKMCDKTKINGKTIAINTFDNSSSRSIGESIINFEIDDRKVRHKFVVVDKMKYDMILGNDFFIEHRINIFPSEGLLRWREEMDTTNSKNNSSCCTIEIEGIVPECTIAQIESMINTKSLRNCETEHIIDTSDAKPIACAARRVPHKWEEEMRKQVKTEKQEEWETYLDKIKFTLNNTVSTITNRTPSEIVFRKIPTPPNIFLQINADSRYINDTIKNVKESIESNTQKYQNRLNIQKYDKLRIGDKIRIILRHISKKDEKSRKMCPLYSEQFTVLDVHSNGNVKMTNKDDYVTIRHTSHLVKDKENTSTRKGSVKPLA
ncbi:hypothetical protein SNEBB_005830 [Seison nebaliae]|nr:hypothetical protein SNEBB_005830 [Seison nebaliae]